MNGWYKALEDRIWLTQLGLNILLPLVLCLGGCWWAGLDFNRGPARCAGRIQRNRAGVSWHTTLVTKSSVLYLCAADGSCVGQFRPGLLTTRCPCRAAEATKKG